MINMKNLKTNGMIYTEYLLWMLIALITTAAFSATYALNLPGPIKVLVWICWIVISLAAGFFTKRGREAVLFAKESKLELQKVVWPTRQETVQTTSIVMIMVAATGFTLWGIDSGMLWAIGKLTHLG
jgi:preprotein translocase subunit SecE